MMFKCGVVGLGRIGCGFDDNPNSRSVNTHAGAYFTNKKTTLTTLCDIDETKLIKYGKKYNVTKLYMDYHEMFKNENLDCVSICTLADSHLQIVEEAVKHNIKGIFLEKPISDNLQNAIKIVNICNEKKIKLQIDYQRRFDPFYQTIKHIINDDKFGKIQHVDIYYGGGIANTGSHIFDLLRFFFSEIYWIEGIYSKSSSNNPADPNVDGTIECRGDIHGTLHSFNLNNYGILEFDILGSRERIRVNLMKSTAEYYEVFHDKDNLVYHELIPKQYTFPNKIDAIVSGLENLLHSIENNVEPLCKGEDGYASLEIVTSMLESANRNGIRIKIH